MIGLIIDGPTTEQERRWRQREQHECFGELSSILCQHRPARKLVPGGRLKAFAEHGDVSDLLPADGGDCEEVLSQFQQAGIDIDALAAWLQRDGAEAFDKP